jgi:hypothetical protein
MSNSDDSTSSDEASGGTAQSTKTDDANQNSQPVDPSQNSQSSTQTKSERKWKLKNAELKILDVYPKKTSGSVAPLVIRMEIKLKNRAKEDSTKIVGKYHFILCIFTMVPQPIDLG